jgi:hypothetical protein
MLAASVAAALWLRDGERRESAAPPAPDAVRDPRIWRLSLASSLMVIGQVGLTSPLVLYLYGERGWSAADAALALSGVQVGAALAPRGGVAVVRPTGRTDRAFRLLAARGGRAAAPSRSTIGRARRDRRASADGRRPGGHELEWPFVYCGPPKSRAAAKRAPPWASKTPP